MKEFLSVFAKRLGKSLAVATLMVSVMLFSNGEAFLARSPVDEVDALEANLRELALPHLDKPDIAAALVSTA